MTDEALAFVRRNCDRPFFLYVAYTIPHAEIVVPEDSLEEYRGRFPETPYPGAHYGAQPEPNAAVAGMITRMDRDIGRLFALLKALELDEKTIVFFSSDNGPVSVGGRDHKFFNAAGGLRGSKGSLFEGGIRVPTIVRWPGRIQANAVSDAVWTHWDVLPTCAEIAGVDPPKNIDGLSILPTLLGSDQPELRDRFLYWEFGRNEKFTQAVRKGDWKAVRVGLDGPISLYNLKKDIAETTDVASKNPNIVTQIENYLMTARAESKDFPVVFSRKPKNE
jgi:arylsulfatase A-like enzyme